MKLALGTVQFGMSYGITNTEGKVSKQEVDKILQLASISGINILDTASSYGDSEKVLGDANTSRFKIISKIPAIANLQTSVPDIISKSLELLKEKTLYGMMFHNESDLFNYPGVIDSLLTAKSDGCIDKIGCSFYSIELLEKALSIGVDLDLIQVPLNCLDQRFLSSGLLQEAKSQGIEVHSRSLFLQGVLLDKNAHLPNALKNSQEIRNFFGFCKLHNLTPLMASLKFLEQATNIDYGVVGCLSSKQLSEIVCSYSQVLETQSFIDFSELSSDNEFLLNPSKWK